jgi:polyhydroxyalkanoate synthesis regulator phasin
MLEGHYTALLKSPAYLQSLCRTLSTVQDLKIAQHRLLTDFLQTLPIPTNKDMDEVYKELYTLKKRVNELTKKKASQESTVANTTLENQ